MKKRTRSLISSACMVAIMAHGLPGGMAQDRVKEKQKEVEVERHTVVVQGDGKTFTVRADGQESGAFNVRVAGPGNPPFDGGMLGPGATWVGASGQQGGDFTFQFFSQEMSFDNRLVKGAPFSAETVSETVQTLADGNRIVQRSEGRLYRDGQGRTRNERTFRRGGSSQEQQTITVYDPNSGENYTLDPESRTARKMMAFMRSPMPPPPPPVPYDAAAGNAEMMKKINVSGGVLQGSATKRVQPSYPPVAKAAQAEGAVQVQIVISETGEVTEATAISGHPLLRDAAVLAARQWEFKPTELAGKAVKVQGVLTFNFTLAKKAEEKLLEMRGPGEPGAYARQGGGQGYLKISSNVEELGNQTIEGVVCEGKRVTTTLPAGAIGNENPIQTIRESWYSPELKMSIMTRQTDPRFGETTYRVTNINRAEPEASLFTVPSDYTIKEGGPAPGAFRFEEDKKGTGEGGQFIRRERPNQR
ncbi:MAG: energy transducer TonB [Blastocatellia bacterium]